MRIAPLIAALPLLVTAPVEAIPPERLGRDIAAAMCARSKEVWTEAETVDEARETPAYDTIYTQCLYEFGEDGRWFSLRYDRSLQVPRRFAWRVERRSLSVLVIETDAPDAQNLLPLLTHVMEDRGVRGRATFGVSGTYGGTESIEHFYEPPDPALGEDDCVAEACARVGARYAEDWQHRYRDALLRAHARLLSPFSNVIRAKETP